ncbi:MAG: hypothetical protein IPM58_18160 [Nitrospira sp.]|nr:hypothetical protein [Nitrospira sp.]
MSPVLLTPSLVKLPRLTWCGQSVLPPILSRNIFRTWPNTGSLLDVAAPNPPTTLMPNTGDAGAPDTIRLNGTNLTGASLAKGGPMGTVADAVGHSMVLSTLVS